MKLSRPSTGLLIFNHVLAGCKNPDLRDIDYQKSPVYSDPCPP